MEKKRTSGMLLKSKFWFFVLAPFLVVSCESCEQQSNLVFFRWRKCKSQSEK